MKTEIKTGDVVTLKSGGLKMTVEIVSSSGYVKCYYYNETKASFEDITFPFVVLQIVD